MAPRSILIVEDVDTMRELLAQLVDGLGGYRVSGRARNTAEARLELSRRRPQLVLLDEVLPGESSLDLLGEVVREGIPVILLTSLEDPAHPLPPGAHSRLAKPDWNSLASDRPRFAQAIAAALAERR
jgi:two-component system response regulator CitB